MDILFDQGYISFQDNGNIIYSNQLSEDVKDYLSSYTLDNNFINNKRLDYLDYHRENIFEKKVFI